MSGDASFWRNAAVIAVVHVGMILTVLGWSRGERSLDAQNIVWITGGGVGSENKTAETEYVVTNTGSSEPAPSKPEEEQPSLSASEERENTLQLPIDSPSPSRIETTRIPQKIIPKPKPKVERKKSTVTKSKSPLPKKTAPAERQSAPTANYEKTGATRATAQSGGDGTKDAGTDSGKAQRASEFSWYGKMLHDRFYSEWVQPTTSTPVGSTISTLVRIRIEKDGRVSNYRIVRPSGNVVVDESVAAIAQKVRQVDPIPNGLSSGEFYEVNISFELNPEKQN